MRSVLKADHLYKEYPTPGQALVILRDVSISLSPGDAVAILGPSGSGKSTLLNILGTLDTPTTGGLMIAEQDVLTLREADQARLRNRSIGFIFQDHHLLPQCTALENVLIPAIPAPHVDTALARGRTLMQRVGLADRMEHFPAQLSGGERQRTAIARALINSPSIVLADEPTGNLDRVSAQRVIELLTELPRLEGVALVVVTHSEAFASAFSRRYELADAALVSMG